MTMNGKDILFGMIGIGSALLAGYSLHKLMKVNEKLENKIDAGVDTIAKACEGQVDISDTIIEEAVDRAVEKHAKLAASNAIIQVKQEIMAKVREEVNKSYKNVEDEVKKELERQVANVDIKSIQKKVVDEAAEKAQSKFSSDLDDILKQYNKKLDDVGTIYHSIAEQLKGRETKSEGLSLKIGG